ncbi:hypothetical protein LCGC14_2538790, partial [marine sediment metagenome]
MNRKEQLELEEYEQQAIAEARQYINHPVTSCFQTVSYISRSKGKGRKRKYPQTITLYRYRLDHNGWHGID